MRHNEHLVVLLQLTHLIRRRPDSCGEMREGFATVGRGVLPVIQPALPRRGIFFFNVAVVPHLPFAKIQLVKTRIHLNIMGSWHDKPRRLLSTLQRADARLPERDPGQKPGNTLALRNALRRERQIGTTVKYTAEVSGGLTVPDQKNTHTSDPQKRQKEDHFANLLHRTQGIPR